MKDLLDLNKRAWDNIAKKYDDRSGSPISARVEEIENYFQPLGFSPVKFNRDIHVSEEFGEEHVIDFIYQKT